MTFVYDSVTEYCLKEKVFSLSGDSFEIKSEESGEVVFRVDGNMLSIHDSKTMLTPDGEEIYKMKDALVSLRDRMFIEECASGDTVYTLRRKDLISLPFVGGRTLLVWKGDSDEGEPWLEIHGDLIRKDFIMKDLESDAEAAVVSRKLLSAQSMFLDSDVYAVRVNPGFDAAVMVFLAIAVDEQYHED